MNYHNAPASGYWLEQDYEIYFVPFTMELCKNNGILGGKSRKSMLEKILYANMPYFNCYFSTFEGTYLQLKCETNTSLDKHQFK